MRLFIGLLASLALAPLSACASPSPKTSSAYTYKNGPFRMAGRALLTSPLLGAQFSVAFLADRQGRMRLDLLLPTGMSAAIFWLVDERWLLLDPSAGFVYNGSLSEASEMLASLPALYQAPLALGLLALRDAASYSQGASAAMFYNHGATAATYSQALSTATGAWRLEYFDYNAAGWPERWQVADGQTTLEVVWQRIEALNLSELRLLEPRVPPSYLPRSWRSLPPVLPVVNPNP